MTKAPVGDSTAPFFALVDELGKQHAEMWEYISILLGPQVQKQTGEEPVPDGSLDRLRLRLNQRIADGSEIAGCLKRIAAQFET